MESKDAIGALSALAQDTRLGIFRRLIQSGAEGLPAGELAADLGVPPSTLSHHLTLLERAGLIRSWRVQRQIFYASDIAGTRALLAFLTEDCCGGQPQICAGLDVMGPAEAAPAATRPFNVLFLCTGNSARSIMAESILNKEGQGRFRAYSAGSHPTGKVNPYALDLLKSMGCPVADLRSKSWDEFAVPDAPVMDFVFTVCDNAAGEVCPVWPGHPATAHWPFPDPAAFTGPEAEKRAHFAEVFKQIDRRIGVFINLPFRTLDDMSLTSRLREMGQGVRA